MKRKQRKIRITRQVINNKAGYKKKTRKLWKYFFYYQ